MFSQNELILMIGVVGTLLFIILVLTIFDIIDYIKSKKKTMVVEEDNLLLEETVPNEEKIEVLDVDDSEIMLDEEVHVSDMDIKEEIEPLIEEINVPIKKNNEIIIDDTIKVQKINPQPQNISVDEQLDQALSTIPNEVDAINKFEEEQERTAIISLDELKNKTDDLYNSNEIMQYDDGDEPISIDEIMNRFNKKEEKEVPLVMQDIVEDKPVVENDSNMPFISNVYGIETNDQSLEFENTATYEKLSNANNKDFMTRLREVSENK